VAVDYNFVGSSGFVWKFLFITSAVSKLEERHMVLEAVDVELSIDKKDILEKVSLKINQGDICILLGANGAGKSSFAKILVGVERPTSGQVRQSCRRIGYVPQRSINHASLSVNELLMYFGKLKNCGRNEVERVMELVGLNPYRGQFASRLSGGYQRRLTLAQALLGDPDVLVLDEPFVGLDQDSIQGLTTILDQFINNGGSMLLTTHVLNQFFPAGCRVIVMENGRIIQQGTYEDIVSHVRLRILGKSGLSILSVLELLMKKFEFIIYETGIWTEILCKKEDRLQILSFLSEKQMLSDWREEPLWGYSEAGDQGRLT
jgi:ABC-type multidrug transport system ATPase subunit